MMMTPSMSTQTNPSLCPHQMSYIPLRGDFKDESDALLIQAYVVPYNYTGYNNYFVDNYYISKVGLYSPSHLRLYEACDNHPFRCKLMGEYNALRIGLENAAKMNASNIVINTNSEKLLSQIIEAFVDDSESENSELSVLSHDVEELHDEVCELLEEFDVIAYRFLDANVMTAFEKYVSDNAAINASMKNLSMSTAHMAMPQQMDIDEIM
jgi:hypothetical protein